MVDVHVVNVTCWIREDRAATALKLLFNFKVTWVQIYSQQSLNAKNNKETYDK